MASNKNRGTDTRADAVLPTAQSPKRYPHIRSRLVAGCPEAYIPGTGLAVWEIAWLYRVHGGEVQGVVEHTDLTPDLVEEALAYAQAHRAEIDPAVQDMEDGSLERLREVLPDIRVIEVEIGPGGHPS